MSEKDVKAKRKEEKEATEKEAKAVKFQIVIDVMNDGGFEMVVPKGASVILTQDVLMRAQAQVWGTLLQQLTAMSQRKVVQPMAGIPEGLLRRPQG